MSWRTLFRTNQAGTAFRSRWITLVIALAVLPLSGCNKKWRIQKVLVNNPAPLGGTDPVNPVIMFAPATVGQASQQSVGVEVVLERDPGFNDVLRVVVDPYFIAPDGH